MYESRIKTLTETHRIIDEQISALERNGKFTDEILSELKKKKLLYKDELARLTRLQWEHDHESVEFDDER